MFRRAWLCSIATAVSACLFAGGCAASLNGNEAREASKELPASFAASTEGDVAARAENSAQKRWNEIFTSPELRTLIESALANNRELNIQLQEVIVAQNELSARTGEYLPKLHANVGAGVEKVGKHTSQGASDEATGLPENLGNFTFGLVGSWEVDVWKKLRNAAKAAGFRYFASVEAKNFTVTQIIAELARSYYDLIALDNQIDILKSNIEIQMDALEAAKLQKEAARVTELAVQRFEAEVLKNKSRLFDVEQERVRTENRINFLVGRYPQPVARNPHELAEPVPDVIRAGLPTQLLDNRPDVRRAEMDLEAAKLDVKAAKAAFYPSLSIDAGLGYRSFNVAHLVATPASLAYGAAGGLTAPLLNRRAIAAEYRSANAKQLQAVFNYEQTLLQAFTDVANQLAMVDNLQKSYELQSRQVDTLAHSVDVSSILFQSARADYMEVLLTRRDSLEGQLTLLETKKRQFQAMVNLYQALGGGWRSSS